MHYLRELVALELIKVTYVATAEQAADSLTKFLRSGSDQKNARRLIGVDELSTGRESPQVCGVASVSRVCVFRIGPPELELELQQTWKT